MSTIRVVVACAGLDHVQRGYETFSRQLVDVLHQSSSMEVTLLKGSGSGRAGERTAHAPRRDKRIAAAAAGLVGGRSQKSRHAGGRSSMSIRDSTRMVMHRQFPVTPYEVEQVGFALMAVPHLVRIRPDVVIVQDVLLAKVWHQLRDVLPGHFRILFVNGSPWPPPYDFADVVQHLTGPSLDAALAIGEPREKNALLSYGLPVAEALPVHDRAGARRQLGLAEDGYVVLSVGALNVRHKRHDHVIREVARLPNPRPHLLIAGAEDEESTQVRRMARDLLGDHGSISTFEPVQMPLLYAASDVFALGSIVEGFGLAYVEALASGLPVIAHNGPIQRWVTGESATLVDMTQPGELAAALECELRRPSSPKDRAARHRDVYQRFSWDVLGHRYTELVEATAHCLP
jgi:glycosyltransferase involved in cell wall biosynthesis